MQDEEKTAAVPAEEPQSGYITVESLEEFTHKYPEEGAVMPQVYVDAARETVEQYLHYDPDKKDYVFSLWGDGTETLVLPAPVLSLQSVTVGGEPQDIGEWEFTKNYLRHRLRNGLFEIFSSMQKIEVAFTGGWDPVPRKIVTAAHQIADLYWESAGGNLAVSSTSFADQGTRVFNNFSESRFLDQINEWRIYNV